MSNGKNGREKTLTTVVIIIVLIIASIFGIDLSQWVPTDSGENPTTIQQETNSENQEESGGQTVQDAEGQLIVTMIDVGQADSFFFQKGEDTALIDCGTRSTGDDVVEYLKEQGITQIDYVFGTHPHDDHKGGKFYECTKIYTKIFGSYFKCSKYCSTKSKCSSRTRTYFTCFIRTRK